MRLSEYIQKANLDPSAAWQSEVEMGKTPFAHQIDDLGYMGKIIRCGILSEPGTGKTLPIQAFSLWLVGYGNRVVAIMPPILITQYGQSLRTNFQGVDKFVTCEAFNGTPVQREKQWEKWKASKFPDIMLMSYIRFVSEYQLLLNEGYACVIVDEATVIKSPTSKIHKAVRAFVGEENGCVLVSGTPVETNIEDCYGFIRILTPDAYSSYKNFEYEHIVKDTWFNPKTGKDVYKTVGYMGLEKLHNMLFQRARRVLKADVSDLPPRLISEYEVELSKPHLNLYNKIVQDRMLEIGDELIDMTTQQALYQATQQVLLNPEKYGKEIKDNQLFEVLDEIIAELEGRKILVYAWFNASIDAIYARYSHLNPAKINGSVTGDAREAAKQKFINDETCKMVVANPKSGGVGVDGFQHVCSHVVYAEVCPFIGTFQQSIDRLHRTGQKSESVNVYVLVAKDTVAVKLRNDLVRKDSYQESVVRDKRAVLADLQGAGGLKGSLDL